MKLHGSKNKFRLFLIFNYFFIFLVCLYKIFISPLIRGNCRFYPTCSDYAIQALKVHSFWKATLLIILRILKCNPFGGKGYDPVPFKKK